MRNFYDVARESKGLTSRTFSQYRINQSTFPGAGVERRNPPVIDDLSVNALRTANISVVRSAWLSASHLSFEILLSAPENASCCARSRY